MSKQDLSKQHLELRNAAQTWFQVDGQEYSVKNAPPAVFDAWIRQFVEEIVNVDTSTWSVFQRWNIINAVLREGLLSIVDGVLKPLEDFSSSGEAETASPAYVEGAQ